MPKDKEKFSTATKLIYGKGHTDAWNYTHHVIPPMTTSTSFRLDSAERGAEGFAAIGNKYPDDIGYQPIYVYDRMGEPNNEMLQQVLAQAEEKEVAITFSSGMAAVTAATMFALNPGDTIVSHKTIYGCSYSLFRDWFPRFGYQVDFVDFTAPAEALNAITDKTKIVYLESPTNPTLDLLDLEVIMDGVNKINAERSEERKLIVVIDNTFATPFCQRPGKFGIDIVVHSLTKSLCGFGTEMGGVVVTDKKFRDQLILFRKDFGSVLAPSSAWHILVYGVSTLPLRLRRQQESALKIAQFLESHPEVEFVYYPGLESYPYYDIAKRMLRDYKDEFAPGHMIYFVLKGSDADEAKERGRKMMNYVAENAYAITLAVSLGQLRTLIEHPGSMTHAGIPAEEQVKAGIHPGGIRLAVGVEEADDVIRGLENALENTRG